MKKKLFKGIGEIAIKAGAVKEDGSFEAVVSGMKVDRYGEIVDVAGWNLKAFKNNPVMLWAHDHSIPAIGRAKKVWVEGNELKLIGEFAPTPFGQEIKMLAENGFLKAFSVGFMAFEMEGNKFTDQELLEVSWVNVPAYAEALVTSAKSMKCELVERALTDGLTAEDLRANAWEVEAKKVEKEKEEEIVEEKSITLTAKEFEDVKAELLEKARAEFEEKQADEIEKAGKKLSKKNIEIIKSAMSSILEGHDALSAMCDAIEAESQAGEDKSAESRSSETHKELSDDEQQAALVKVAMKSLMRFGQLENAKK
jgi:HK97 family phage prohead protease